MKIEQSELKDLTAVVTLTIEPADYQDEVAKQLKQVRQKAQMPGFRPGMVPAGLVKKMYGKGILADVLNKQVGEGLQKHIEDVRHRRSSGVRRQTERQEQTDRIRDRGNRRDGEQPG